MNESEFSNPAGLSLLVAIPCLNESENLESLLPRIPRAINGFERVDVLVVDDGSTDDTASVAKKHGAIVVSHRTNRGVGAAFATASQYALENGYSMLVNLDGDNQFNPEDIPLLCAPVAKGEAEMATASRFLSEDCQPAGIPKAKLYGNKMMSAIISNLVRTKFYDVSCGFRCYGREALLRMTLSGIFTYTQESIIDLSVRHLHIKEVPIKVQYFKDRKSRVAGNLWRYGLKSMGIILRSYRDYFPLRFFWGIALFFLLPSLILGGIFFYHYLSTGFFSGALYAGFSSAFLFILAIIFFVVGIFADMFVRLRINQENILYRLKK